MASKVVIRSPYDPVARVVLDCSQSQDMAKQSFKDECEVNNIVRRYEMGGELPAFSGEPLYADVSGMEFQGMMDVVASAQAAFEALPAEVRRRFANDPREFVEFVSDPGNRAEALKMGLTRGRKSDSLDPAAIPRRRKEDQDGSIEKGYQRNSGGDGALHSQSRQGEGEGDYRRDRRGAADSGVAREGPSGSGSSGRGAGSSGRGT